jgi:hypothetical protein
MQTMAKKVSAREHEGHRCPFGVYLKKQRLDNKLWWFCF